MKLTEDVLHYVWKYRLYRTVQLRTWSGKSLIVHSPGIHNAHAGPDFEHARLSIEDTEWAGNVEIHVRSSDWLKHRHTQDSAYNTVILHVVYEFDEEVTLPDGTVPETLVLAAYLSPTWIRDYSRFMESEDWLLCRTHLQKVEPFKVSQWLSRVGIERLALKTQQVNQLLEAVRGDWNELTYILLARNFGFKVNAQPFEQVARNLPYRLISKYKDDPIAIEALIFGQAGFLEETAYQEDYPKELQRRYEALRQLHRLKPIARASWKFLKMRPLNFPTIRLAQFAAWCAGRGPLFSLIMEMETAESLRKQFSDLPVNSYWTDHYRFNVVAKKHSAGLGKASIDNILLNTVVIILFAYGKYIGKEPYIYGAIDLLEQLASERNHIVQKYETYGVKISSAASSQALLQLKQAYCDPKRCLACGIGLEIFKQNRKL